MNDQSTKVVRLDGSELNLSGFGLGSPELALQWDGLGTLSGDGLEARVDDEFVALVAMTVVLNILTAGVLGLTIGAFSCRSMNMGK